MVLTTSQNRAEGEIRVFRRKALSVSLIPMRFNHRCHSITTIAAIEGSSV